jgi:hypothetical protein
MRSLCFRADSGVGDILVTAAEPRAGPQSKQPLGGQGELVLNE